MEWDRDKSLLLSRVCVWLFAGALAALCAGAPWLWPWLVGRPEGAAWYMAVTYITAVPAAVVLYGLHRLLQFKAFIQQIIAAVKALYRCRQQHCRKAEAHQLLYQAKASAIFHKQSPCL